MAKATISAKTNQSDTGLRIEKNNGGLNNNGGLDNANEPTAETRQRLTGKYRNELPQLKDGMFLTDGGLETTLVFHRNLDLPLFASFPLLDDPAGVRLLRDYYAQYAALARDLQIGFIFESVTWRANPDWAAKLGYSEQALAKTNRRAIDFLREIRDEYETEKSKMVVSGCIGPRGDGYSPSQMMTESEALEYHRAQINVFGETEADLVSALTLNYTAEAIGIARAAQAAQIPAVISFTVETDGRLPSGNTLREAVEKTDEATNAYPAYYMINCAHPTHFRQVIESGERWLDRIQGIRANSSVKSHAELDESAELDEGNPAELGRQYRELFKHLKNLHVVGGCCGTDFRHIQAIAGECLVKS